MTDFGTNETAITEMLDIKLLKQYIPQSPTSNKQRPIETTCPECGGKALIWKVQKEGRNKGRPMLFCDDKDHCKFTKFMDLPHCDFCGTEKYEGMVKGGKNKGRRYTTCPHRCPCSFQWK